MTEAKSGDFNLVGIIALFRYNARCVFDEVYLKSKKHPRNNDIEIT